MIIAKVYDTVTRSYGYVEHSCAVAYAVNEFTSFDLAKKCADGVLIILLMIVVAAHVVKRVGPRCFTYRCRFEIVR